MQTFEPSYSLPPEGSNFVSAPPIRGTLQILWTCISILILCNWSVVHLNVPPQNKQRNGKRNLKRWLFKTSKRPFTKALWMMMNTIVPEGMLLWALLDFLSIRGLRSKLVAQAQKDDVPWSDTHTHFANMGGFGISFANLDTQQVKTSIRDTSNASIWAKRAEKFLRPGDAKRISRWTDDALFAPETLEQDWQVDPYISELIAKALDSPDLSCLDGVGVEASEVYSTVLFLRANLWIPSARQLLLIRELEIISSLPKVDLEDLEDRSKSNLFIKAITFGQIGWFVLQFIVRYSRGMTVTQLELMVFAFATVSILSYVLVWDRPKDPTYMIRLNAANYPAHGSDIINIASQAPQTPVANGPRRAIWIANTMKDMQGHLSGTMTDYSLAFACCLGSWSAFGAIHCLAWNSAFPSEIERVLWRAGSIIMIVGPVTLLMCAGTLFRIARGTSNQILYGFILVSCCLSCLSWLCICAISVPARIFMIVEALRSLAFQPPDAFQATWVNSLPHV